MYIYDLNNVKDYFIKTVVDVYISKCPLNIIIKSGIRPTNSLVSVFIPGEIKA